MSERRFLLGILVYNGRDVVPACLDSAAALMAPNVDVMVFDDCSPSPGWSADVAAMCQAKGIGCYRTPRNLGIPRNMSLVMRTAEFERYDVVGLVNSDVVMPTNLIEVTSAVFDQHPGVASVTPWSNNVSVFSLPMQSGGAEIAEQRFVSDLADALYEVHGGEVVDVPTGVGYCLMIDVETIRSVGVMDPVFGRGYCEEVDWCQRAHESGLRHVLALGTYVFHAGNGTNRDEGLLAHGEVTVVEHELVLRGRYPGYMPRVLAFVESGDLRARGTKSLSRAFVRLAARYGYDVCVSNVQPAQFSDRPLVRVEKFGSSSSALVCLHGIEVPLHLADGPTPESLQALLGRPASVSVAEPGAFGEQFRQWGNSLQLPWDQPASYPTRV